jgi:hypothetical protein
MIEDIGSINTTTAGNTTDFFGNFNIWNGSNSVNDGVSGDDSPTFKPISISF